MYDQPIDDWVVSVVRRVLLTVFDLCAQDRLAEEGVRLVRSGPALVKAGPKEPEQVYVLGGASHCVCACVRVNGVACVCV